MTTTVRSNPDGSSTVLVGAVPAIEISSAGTLTAVLRNYTDDVAAAAGGIPLGGMYRTGATVKCRIS
jgi:hypothetical protein